jgi:hypothetical protein
VLAAAAAVTPLWLDELHQLVGTHQTSLAEMLHWAKASPGGTPLNFLAQKLVLDTVGLSSLAARLPAVLFGVGSLWAFMRIAREYLDKHWILAVGMFAALPQIFRYGVEARPYSQGMFFALLAFWFWLKLEREPSKRHAAAFALAVAGGLYSQVFSVFVAAGQTAWSLRNPKSRMYVIASIAAAGASYLPWFLTQRATQAVTHTMSNYSFSWDQISALGFIRELSGGGYFCSVPLLILAAMGRDSRLGFIAATGLALPVAADAMLGYFFAGRQLIFALPFLILLAAKGLDSLRQPMAALLIAPLFVASAVSDFKQATNVREDWATPAHWLASHNMSGAGCVYVWSADQLAYLQVYEPQLKQCDPANLPDEFPYVTTKYSPPPDPPKGFVKIRSERVGTTEIALYRRDDRLKTYGLSRFIFRT